MGKTNSSSGNAVDNLNKSTTLADSINDAIKTIQKHVKILNIKQGKKNADKKNADQKNADQSCVNGYKIAPGQLLKDANLRNAKLSGARLSNANLTNADLTEADLSESKLNYAMCNGIKGSKSNFKLANFVKTDLTNADLCLAKLTRTTFYGANLNNANLTKANFSGAFIGKTTLDNANLTEATLQYTRIVNGSSFKKAKLCGASLNGAIIADTNLTDADFTGASLINTNCYNLTFTNVNLTSANLTSANFGCCIFDKVIISPETNVTRAVIPNKYRQYFEGCVGFDQIHFVDSSDKLVNSNSDSASVPDVKTDSVPDVKTDSVPDVKTDSVPDVKTDSIPDVKTDSIPDVKTDSVPDVKTDSVPDPYPSHSTYKLKTTDNKIKLDKLKNFTKCYTKEWMGNYNNWIKFTTAFIRAFNGNNYKEYDEICKKFPKYNSTINLKVWNKIIEDNNGYTNSHLAFNSFRHWAEKQNPTEYSKLTNKDEKKLKYLKTLVDEKYTDKWMSEYKNWLIFTMAFKNEFSGNYYEEYDKICSKFSKYDAKNNFKKWGQINLCENSKIGFDLFKHWANQQDAAKQDAV